MSVVDQLSEIRKSLPPHVTLVAVSKTHPSNLILEAYQAGQRDFGENKVQEMCAKAEALPKDIRWHLIGHLQSNKVKYIAGFVHMVHSVDSVKLLLEIDKQAAKFGRVVNCLLQVHIADEETKFGLNPDEVAAVLSDAAVSQCRHVCIKGLMGMASFTNNTDHVRREFASLAALFNELKSQQPQSALWQPEVLSMGMSGDAPIAIEEGSNMVRVGSAIFGARNYA